MLYHIAVPFSSITKFYFFSIIIKNNNAIRNANMVYIIKE